MNYWRLSLTSLMLVGILPLTCNLAVQAQSTVDPKPSDRTIADRENTIYVDPKHGDDRVGEGSERSPLKTITQALMLAKPKTLIQLAPGTYSKETGESFPLVLRSDITLQGSPQGQGYNVIIRGSGYFISPTAAGQHISVVAMRDAAEITGVTIINPENRGYGLWIESANPKVIGNTFTRNGNTGLSVNGNSAPLIANNYFYNNMGNGLTIYDNAKPEVKDNVFDKTGYAISIVENAAPILTGNRLNGNRVGIILQGQSQASLRNNTIEKSSESGLVAIAEAQVDLGTTQEPGGNIFQNNVKVDIQNVGKGQIAAFGNQVSGRTEGKIDLAGNKLALNSPNNSASRLSPLPISKNPVDLKAIGNSNTENSLVNRNNLPKLFLSSPSPSASPPLPSSTNTENELVFTAPNSSKLPANRNNNRSLSPLPPAISSSSPNRDRPVIENRSETLPPPPPIKDPGEEKNIGNEDSTDAEISKGGKEENLTQSSNLDRLPVPNSLMSSPSANNRIAVNSAKTKVYRVMAEADSSDRQQRVRSLYPEAFTTVFQGKPMLQVGVFSSRDKAETVLNSLENLGLNATIAQ
jgi:parallel beta-helix repeat protein